jgi:hypothetical protein
MKTLKNIKIGDYFYDYTGMVNKENQPHGFGRAIKIDNSWFIDG